MEAIDLDAVEIPRDVLDLLSPSVANIYRIVPVRFDRDADVLTVAMADPKNVAALEDLRFMLGCFVSPLAADEAAVSRAIEKYYSCAWRIDMLDELIAQCESYRPFTMKAVRRRIRHAYHAMAARVWGVFPSRLSGKAGESHRRWELAVSVPFVKLTHILILMAIREEASGIVIALSEEGGKVSFRDEKGLREIRSFSPKVARLVMRRLRRMAKMKRDPETGVDRGTIQLNLLGRDFECRVTGESVEDGERLRLQLVAKGGREGKEESAG